MIDTEFENAIHKFLDDLGIPQASEYNSFPLLDRVRTLGELYKSSQLNNEKLTTALTIAVDIYKDSEEEIRRLEFEVEGLYRSQCQC